MSCNGSSCSTSGSSQTDCTSSFPFIRGIVVNQLPKKCEFCNVLRLSDCTLFQKSSRCRDKSCTSCSDLVWVEVNMNNQPYVFLDVCSERFYPVGFSGQNLFTSNGTVFTTIDSLTSSLGSSSTGTTAGCTFSVAPGTALVGMDGDNMAEISVCNKGITGFSGSIGGCMTNSLIITKPGTTATDRPCFKNPFDASNTLGEPMLWVRASDASSRIGIFRAGDLSASDTLSGQSGPPFNSHSIGAYNRNTAENTFTIGINALGYIPGAFTQSSCLTTPTVPASPPENPKQPDQGTCQYVQVVLKGVTRCVTGADLQNVFCDPIACEPPLPEIQTDCNYYVTDFRPCDNSNNCLYLPYNGSAFGELDVAGSQVVTCTAKFLPTTPEGFGQRWCFGIDRIQTNYSIYHSSGFLQSSCGNNIVMACIAGATGGETCIDGVGETGAFIEIIKYSMCILPTGCTDNNTKQFCFSMVRHEPIPPCGRGSLYPPNFCATLKMTMVSAIPCTPVPCNEEATPDCYVICPIKVNTNGCIKTTACNNLRLTDDQNAKCSCSSSTSSTAAAFDSSSTSSSLSLASSSVSSNFSMPNVVPTLTAVNQHKTGCRSCRK